MGRSHLQAPLLRRLGIWACCCALSIPACSEPPAEPVWPEGTLLLGRTEALEPVLERLTRLEGTPLARAAHSIRSTLPGCRRVAGRAETGGLVAAASALECIDSAGDFQPLDRARGDRDLAFAVPLADGARAIGLVTVMPAGDVEVELSLPEDSIRGLGRLLLPGGEAPGPPVLSSRERLAHARVRPEDGLDLASLVPAGSQGARLFRLESELFAGVVLDGTWEAALYLPAEGRPMPRAALALGFRNRSAAQAAMDVFISNLEETWPVRRSPFALGEASGACLLDLRLLPDLSPCYVATDRALVIGWNPASLRRALDGAPADTGDALSGAIVDLARLRDADAHLARTTGGRNARTAWPWERVDADGATRDGEVEIRVRLRGGPGA